MPKEDTNAENFDIDKLAEKMKKLRTEFMSEFEYDPSMFFQFTRDFMRIDVGLMI